MFVIASMVHYTGVIFYAIFASGEKQDWADPESTSEDKCGIIGEDELADESEAGCDSSLASSAKKKSYGAMTTDSNSGRKQGWKKNRGVTAQEEEEEEEEEGQYHYENGNFQDQYQ